MDLLGRYSNHDSDLIGRVARVRGDGSAAEGADGPSNPPLRQAQKRLTEAEISEMATAYRAGSSVHELAARFGVHRSTVSRNLKAKGVTLRYGGVDPAELAAAVALYEAGWSFAKLGAHFGVGASTMRNAFVAAGHPTRPRTW